MAHQGSGHHLRQHSMPSPIAKAAPWDPTHVDATPLHDEDRRLLDDFPKPLAPPTPLDDEEKYLLTRFPDVPRSHKAGLREAGRHDGHVRHRSGGMRVNSSKISHRPHGLLSRYKIRDTSFLLSDSENGDSDHSSEDSDWSDGEHSFRTQSSGAIPSSQQDLRPLGRASSKKNRHRQERSHPPHTIYSSRVSSSSSPPASGEDSCFRDAP